MVFQCIIQTYKNKYFASLNIFGSKTKEIKGKVYGSLDNRTFANFQMEILFIETAGRKPLFLKHVLQHLLSHFKLLQLEKEFMIKKWSLSRYSIFYFTYFYVIVLPVKF